MFFYLKVQFVCSLVMLVQQNIINQFIELIFVEMAKANSFKLQPWVQFQRGAYSIFDDDFITDKLTLKFNKKSNTSTVALKNTFHISKEGKINKSQEELKFWFPFRDTHTLYFRLKNDSYKIHYDNGVYENNGYRFNFYASLQGKRNFYIDINKLGLETRKDDWSTNFRVAFNTSEGGATLYNKTYLTQDRMYCGFVNAFQVIAKSWIHSAFQLGYKDNDGNEYFLRANAGKKFDTVNPVHYLQDITADYVYKYNSLNNLGIQIKGNLSTREVTNASFIWDHKCIEVDTRVKLKADINRNISASIKNPIAGFGNYIFGVQVHDLGGANKFNYGIQVDLNL